MTALATLTMLWSAIAQATTPVDIIRVYAIAPDSFDYVFTSVVSSSDKDPVLSLNHRNGKTFFVRPGDTLEKYRITAFEPKTERVFNQSVNSYLEKQSGKVTLEDPEGETIILEMGKRVPQQGRVAYLVSLTTGNWWFARAKNTFSIGDTTITVYTVSENSVTISIDNAEQSIPMISQEEKEKLVLLWNEYQKQREEKRELAKKRQKEKKEKQTAVKEISPHDRPHQTVEIRYPTKIFFGTEYRYPSEVKVLPSIWSASGELIQPATVVPTRFKTRKTGINLQYR